MTIRNLDVSERIHRSSWCVREWTCECQCLWLVLFQGTLNGDSHLAPLEVISSLVTQLLRTVQEGRLADEKVPPDEGMGSSSAGPPVTGAERGHSAMEWARVCFSCGRQGHGVNRCSQVDTSFPFLPQGWSVDVRNGQYRAIRTGGTGMWSTPDVPGGRVSLPDHRGPRYN